MRLKNTQKKALTLFLMGELNVRLFMRRITEED